MPSRACVAVLLLAVTTPATPKDSQALAAQLYPGDPPRPPAFPTGFSVWALLGWAGPRSTRSFVDSALCGPTNCVSEHALTGSLGLGARLQASLSQRTGIRLGLAVSGPKRKLIAPNSRQINERLTLLRAEALLLFRLKPQAPAFFGAGAALGRFSPGPTEDQGDVTELGAALAVGIDRRLKPNLGTRFEWTVFLMKPTTAGLPGEYEAQGLTFDNQFSFGVIYYVR